MVILASPSSPAEGKKVKRQVSDKLWLLPAGVFIV
jgi:hypothetical protein